MENVEDVGHSLKSLSFCFVYLVRCIHHVISLYLYSVDGLIILNIALLLKEGSESLGADGSRAQRSRILPDWAGSPGLASR